jgi:uncharacterized protein (DUF427 family)
MLNPVNVLNNPILDTIIYRALAGDTVVATASAKDIVLMEGNVYFPPDAVDWDRLEPSERTSVCPWKGTANYYDVVVDGERFPAAAWTYESPSPAALQIAGRIAFWRGVRVTKD